jgi:hypothetical protein
MKYDDQHNSKIKTVHTHELLDVQNKYIVRSMHN